MDPITLSVITSAVTVLASEYGKGVASEAGKTTWTNVRKLLGWEQNQPATAEVAIETAKKLSSEPDLTEKLVDLLRRDGGNEIAGKLVSSITIGSIQARTVITAETISIENFKG